jgi:IclR family pca regulon transcriptional regulator
MENSRNFIESLSRGLVLLSALSESSSPLSLTELSDQLHLSKSTIQRLTYTLQHLGYLGRHEETKKYFLGSKVVSLGFSIMRTLGLREIAVPFLEEASRELDEAVNLAILDGTEIVYVERIKTQGIFTINLHVGSRLPAYCTSTGKVMLAFLPQKRLEELLERIELKPFTCHTVKSKEELKRELKRIRERGFSINNEEGSIGLRSVAAPVRNYSGEVIAAVNIAVPSNRGPIRKLETFFAKKVIETADKISFRLGYYKDKSK